MVCPLSKSDGFHKTVKSLWVSSRNFTLGGGGKLTDHGHEATARGRVCPLLCGAQSQKFLGPKVFFILKFFQNVLGGGGGGGGPKMGTQKCFTYQPII